MLHDLLAPYPALSIAPGQHVSSVAASTASVRSSSTSQSTSTPQSTLPSQSSSPSELLPRSHACVVCGEDFDSAKQLRHVHSSPLGALQLIFTDFIRTSTTDHSSAKNRAVARTFPTRKDATATKTPSTSDSDLRNCTVPTKAAPPSLPSYGTITSSDTSGHHIETKRMIFSERSVTTSRRSFTEPPGARYSWTTNTHQQ